MGPNLLLLLHNSCDSTIHQQDIYSASLYNKKTARSHLTHSLIKQKQAVYTIYD